MNCWKLADQELRWGSRPLVMGILNVTPDSFSDGGLAFSPDQAIARGIALADQGADLLDIGGESTRPGATPVEVSEELRRVIPVIEGLRGKIRIPISVDTTKAEVARQAIQAGALIVNDVSGGEWDAALWSVVASTGVGYVLMHCQGRPATMQRQPMAGDVVVTVNEYLKNRLLDAERAGISSERVVCDVGIGFGKTMEQNWQLLRMMHRFASLGRPLLVGLSRKSLLRPLAGESIESATVAAHVGAALGGASIWRTHDVSSAVAAARVVEALCGEVA